MGRRSILATAASIGLTSVSGCLRDVRSVLSRDSPTRVRLSIATVPADYDPYPVMIANRLRSHLESIGIEVGVDLLSIEELRARMLLNHDFDIAIARHPGDRDPDFLFGLLHSSFAPESGWQNPYGYSNLDLDSMLEEQRRQSDILRQGTVGEVLTVVARTQPFSPLCVPTERRLVRVDRIEGARGRSFSQPTDILGLRAIGETEELRFAIRETSPTENLNPLSVEYRDRGLIMGLLYDRLALEVGDDYHPWLAQQLDWRGDGVEVTLRESTWHDGESVTADDVAFTYRFLADTALGSTESPVPTPRLRGRSRLVDTVETVDERTVDITFDAHQEVASRALTTPILPEHIWEDRSVAAELGGIPWDDTTTEALVLDNIPPVGSGPYRYVDSVEREFLELERVEQHFANDEDVELPYRPPADRLFFDVVPNEGGALAGIEGGDIDLTLASIRQLTIEDPLPDDVALVEVESPGFYHVAFNVRNQPLSNTNFRRIVARLLDKEHLVDDVFDGTARPVAVPVDEDPWAPASLRWDGADPEVPFLGEDGVLNATTAREAMTEVGFRYDEDGFLIERGE
ncbi:MAG: ABC transporter substrate-binding protein [Halobacteriota archaeon]